MLKTRWPRKIVIGIRWAKEEYPVFPLWLAGPATTPFRHVFTAVDKRGLAYLFVIRSWQFRARMVDFLIEVVVPVWKIERIGFSASYRFRLVGQI